MAVDLKYSGLMRKRSLVLLEDQLVSLDHQLTRDRVRRIGLDRVSSVVMWKRLPWAPMLVFLLIVGLPGFGLLFLDEPVSTTIGCILLFIMLLIEAYYAYKRKTLIRITRAGQDHDFKVLAWPGQVQRFLSRLQEHIQRTQESAEASRIARRDEAPPDPDLDQVPADLDGPS